MWWLVQCSICGAEGASPCARCAAALSPAHPVTPPDCDQLLALFAYDERGARLVAAIKFHNDRSCLHWAGEQLAALLHPVDANLLVTWIPTTSRRKRARGFDQAEAISRQTARALNVDCRRLLLRLDDVAQTGKDLFTRRESAPRFLAGRRSSGRNILLIDDVATTGATLSGAARSLRTAGATSVNAAVLAYTSKRV